MAKRSFSRSYVCGTCGGSLGRNGTGLGTWTCRQHPFRMVTVTKDLSAGKEADRSHREVGISVKRHTLVRVDYTGTEFDSALEEENV